MRLVCVMCAVVMSCGCYTYKDKVAHKGAELILEQRGADGDALAGAWAGAVREANIDSGAAEITAAEVELTSEAGDRLAAEIRSERAARSALWSGIKSLSGKLAERLPWIGPAVGFAAAAVEWLRRRRAQLQSARASEIVGVLGRLAGKVTPESIEPEVPGMVDITVSDVTKAVDAANNSEI